MHNQAYREVAVRYLFGFVCVLALGLMGCSETSGTGGSGGIAGNGGVGGEGGNGGDGGAAGKSGTTFSYSVITSNTGEGADLLDELRASTLPTLEEAGAVVYALWGPATEQDERFSEISEDKIVVMLSWAQVDAELLTTELEALAGASEVDTSLWEASLRGGEPLPTGEGFYIHRFNRYQTEDVDQVLSLSERAWVTWEPFWEAKAIAVWRDLEEEDGLAHLLRIAWYRDLQHWDDTRDGLREPDSAVLFLERRLLEVDVLDNRVGWSASLLER
jgi:hypothetical protein